MKRMSDDEIQDFAWSKIVGDLDGVASHGMFDSKESKEPEMTPLNDPKLDNHAVGHEVHIHVHPNMEAADHGDPAGQQVEKDDLEDLKDHSEIFARLHKK